jgi:LysR family transcriptional regulator, transcriptional activator for bauABCD operon
MANALPDLKLLRIFVSVVRHQGFANAQQELNLSTSAISTYMSQLEAALGLVLCHRGRGGFSLTSKGELFHQETLRLLGELEGFEQYSASSTPPSATRPYPSPKPSAPIVRNTRPCICTCRS